MINGLAGLKHTSTRVGLQGLVGAGACSVFVRRKVRVCLWHLRYGASEAQRPFLTERSHMSWKASSNQGEGAWWQRRVVVHDELV